MAVSRRSASAEELDDHSVADVVRSYISLQARDWQRRQRNRIVPAVLALVDQARANGDAVDVPALVRQVFLENQLPELE